MGTGEDPLSRGYMDKTGMKSTTGDLNLGTSKAAYHIPGYGGYIPHSTSNPGNIEQGMGESRRKKTNDLRLFHRHNLPVCVLPVEPLNVPRCFFKSCTNVAFRGSVLRDTQVTVQ